MSEDRIINLDLYADQAGRKLVDSGGSSLTLAPVTLGDQLRCSLRNLVQDSGGDWSEQDLPIRSLRASVGNILTPPSTGSFKLRRTYLVDGVSTQALSDAILATANAADFATACATVFGQTPSEVALAAPGCWIFHLPDGSELLDVDSPFNRLDPVAFVRVRSYQRFGSEWWTEVRLIQTPVAWNEDGFERVLPPQPSIRRIRAGAPATDSSPAVNEIQALTLSADFVGTYVLRLDLRPSIVLGMQAGPSDIEAALNALFTDGENRFNVTNPEDENAYIEFTGDLGGLPQDLIEVDVNTFAPGVVTFVLPLDRAEMVAALRSVTSATFQLELEAELGDPDNPDEPGRIVTLFRAPLIVQAEEIYSELATVPSLDWQRPPAAKDYIPYTPDQILVGQQNYVASFGDGESTEFNFTHNLGTESISNITVRENISGGRVLGLGMEYNVEITSANELALYLGFAPDANALAIVITSAGPISAFLAHTHTMAQIIGLEDALAALGARIAAIEALLPSLTLAQSSAGASVTLTIPPFSELFPPPVSNSVTIDPEAVAKAPSILPPTRRAPGLLPAIHDATTAALADPFGDVVASEGDVFQNLSGSPVLVPGALGRKSVYAPASGFVGSDGRAWYLLNQSGSTNSYYPADFERDLFVIPFAAEMWQPGQRFVVEFDLDLVLLNANSAAQYAVIIEAGTAPAQTTPAPVDPINLADIVWNDTPILKQRVVMTGLRITHHFGARIMRSVSDVLTSDKLLYTSWSNSNAGAPTATAFVLRARLAEFDTENSVADARGFVFRALGTASAQVI